MLCLVSSRLESQHREPTSASPPTSIISTEVFLASTRPSALQPRGAASGFLPNLRRSTGDCVYLEHIRGEVPAHYIPGSACLITSARRVVTRPLRHRSPYTEHRVQTKQYRIIFIEVQVSIMAMTFNAMMAQWSTSRHTEPGHIGQEVTLTGKEKSSS